MPISHFLPPSLQVVIANQLQRRHTEVTVVTPEEEEVIKVAEGETEIEKLIVDRIVALHTHSLQRQ